MNVKEMSIRRWDVHKNNIAIELFNQPFDWLPYSSRLRVKETYIKRLDGGLI